MSSPKNLQEFYPFAVNIIYAVIVALSFEIATKVLVPVNTVFESYDDFVRALALLLSYFFIISGWIGYTKSITKHPHSENSLGNARFVIDLLILFLAFYLLTQTDPLKFASFSSVFSTFIWIFPISFGMYIIWDAFKYFEYKTSISRWRTTWYYFVMLLILAILYSNVIIPHYYNNLMWGSNIIWEFPFTVALFVIIFFYRKRKWPDTETSLSKKARKRRISLGV